jgi:hypothetical protein
VLAVVLEALRNQIDVMLQIIPAKYVRIFYYFFNHVEKKINKSKKKINFNLHLLDKIFRKCLGVTTVSTLAG